MGKLRTRWAVGAVAGLLAGLLAPGVAVAAVGSLVAGSVWADTDRDGVRDASEPASAGVTVNLLDSLGVVVSSATTAADGTYAFADVVDGSYRVQVEAPGAFTFATSASGDNDIVADPIPAAGNPTTGSAPVTVSGASQVTGLDAGLRPRATLQVAPRTNGGCGGTVLTGTAPFDPSDITGSDSSATNCRIRTGDTSSHPYSIALTGLPTGVSVDNVVAEFTISSADGATFRFGGAGANGMPTGCRISGVTPASTIVTNPDGSVTLRCNLGTFTSTAKLITIPVIPNSDAVVDSHYDLDVQVYAAGGDAASSPVVDGPDIQVTSVPRVDVSQSLIHIRRCRRRG
jgi:hypothetical protein